MDPRQRGINMFQIDWLRLDWLPITAGIFGILAGIFFAVRLKNYFYRWSFPPPNLENPSSMQVLIRRERKGKQVELSWARASPNANSAVIWVEGAAPRFLINVAWGLALHCKSVVVNEISKRVASNEVQKEAPGTCQIFYGQADAVETMDQEFQKIILVNPKLSLQSVDAFSADEKIAIIGERIQEVRVESNYGSKFSVVHMPGGPKFRGHELLLLGCLIKEVGGSKT